MRRLLEEHRGRTGAAVGYFGYDLRRHIECLPGGPPDDLGLPDLYLGFYEPTGDGWEAPTAPTPTEGCLTREVTSNFTRSDYERAVERAVGYISQGDIYQVNLSQRFSVACEYDAFEVYERLRQASPAPYAALLSFPGFAVISSSPECFIRFDPESGVVETRPIKGTRPRGADPLSDRALADDLLSSAKDRAENLMIVDLERNDLGRVAAIGSVEVPSLFELETFPNVHHLTSCVRARLDPRFDAVDLLTAMFPCGSITGAPKIRAMQIIDEMEPVARGPYTGAIGYIGFDGSVELSVAIRTMVLKDGRAYFHAGGGIVADSLPALEYEETLHKASGIARALGARLWT
jgi:aminodeoxychorismate synthase component I